MRTVLDANRYMTLATADADGRPWVSPVWFAHEGRDLVWVSKPGARHSRNLAARPEVAVVVFDSTVAPAEAKAVYMEAVAAEVPEEERPRALDIFSRRSVAQGLSAWTAEDVVAPAAHRLYRASVTEAWTLGDRDERLPLAL